MRYFQNLLLFAYCTLLNDLLKQVIFPQYLGKVGVIKAKLPNGIKLKSGQSELINTVKVQFSDGKV